MRGETTATSDLDLLAGVLRPISLLELVGAGLYLREVLRRKADLAPKRCLHEELRELILVSWKKMAGMRDKVIRF